MGVDQYPGWVIALQSVSWEAIGMVSFLLSTVLLVLLAPISDRLVQRGQVRAEMHRASQRSEDEQ